MHRLQHGFTRSLTTHPALQDFNIEKLQLLESEKAKIRKDYERREGQIEVKKKMCGPLLFCRSHAPVPDSFLAEVSPMPCLPCGGWFARQHADGEGGMRVVHY
jgi:hypothetical protein